MVEMYQIDGFEGHDTERLSQDISQTVWSIIISSAGQITCQLFLKEIGFRVIINFNKISILSFKFYSNRPVRQ